VFDVLGALGAASVDARLVLGGPLVDARDERLLRDGLARAGEAAEYLGACQRDDVLDRCDVFLFPTRYPDESWGLVAWEAMLHGLPLLAYRAGCLTAEAVGQAGVVLAPDTDFAGAASPVLERWAADEPARLAAGRAASTVAARTREDGRSGLAELARAIAA
ncbi:MAG TPA: glycosyltransferase, partial [Solirubrobacteraceae bacterium]